MMLEEPGYNHHNIPANYYTTKAALIERGVVRGTRSFPPLRADHLWRQRRHELSLRGIAK